MATVNPDIWRSGDGSILVYQWETINDSNLDGAAVQIPAYADKTIQFIGSFGGGTIVLQGSNGTLTTASDGSIQLVAPTNWATLNDPTGTAISTSAAALWAVLENPLWIRPLASGGTSKDIDVILTVRRPTDLRQ